MVMIDFFINRGLLSQIRNSLVVESLLSIRYSVFCQFEQDFSLVASLQKLAFIPFQNIKTRALQYYKKKKIFIVALVDIFNPPRFMKLKYS